MTEARPIHSAPSRSRSGGGAASGLAIAVALLLLAIPSAMGGSLGTPPVAHRPAALGPTTVPYSSTVDRFGLSFLEWLPPSYLPEHSYPLTVYFHGMGAGTSWVKGGVGASSIPSTLVRGAAAFGSVLISLNTRSESGFYANTACGGPQEQDVLDAIAVEKSARSISSVYFVGFSMGSLGALTLAARHPGLVSGLATAGTITDLFQVYAFGASLKAAPTQVNTDLCGGSPSLTNASAVRFFVSESPARFDPVNFSKIPMYVTAGGADLRAPNNFAIWPYADVNSTFLNSSCKVVSTLAEPASCTTPFAGLAIAHPGLYHFRFVYEATAPHDALQLNATDMFQFLFGLTSTGFYTAGYPPVSVVRVVPQP